MKCQLYGYDLIFFFQWSFSSKFDFNFYISNFFFNSSKASDSVRPVRLVGLLDQLGQLIELANHQNTILEDIMCS